MATCLMVWFGQVVQQDGIHVFSRLGGKYLGNFKLPSKSLSAFQKVRFLQQQAARLCPHPTRTCEDILLYANQTQVGPPNMAYLDDLNEEANLQVQQLLDRSTRLEMMWDEDDVYAKCKVEQAGIRVTDFGDFLKLSLTVRTYRKNSGISANNESCFATLLSSPSQISVLTFRFSRCATRTQRREAFTRLM